MSKRIVILNDGLGPNKGDQAILRAMLSTLKSLLPDAEISALSYHWKLKELPKEIVKFLRSDLVILGGGQVLHDQTSVSFTLMVLSKVALARVLRARVMGYGIGVGPLKTGIARWMSRRILSQFGGITVREPASKKWLADFGVTQPPVAVAADASFLLEPAGLDRVKEIFVREGLTRFPQPVVAIAPRRWFQYHHGLLPVKYKARLTGSVKGHEEFKRLEQTIARVADQLVTEKGASVLFVPMRRSHGRVDPGQDDDRVASEIIDLMNRKEHAKILTQDYNPEELKGILGQMALVIGMRMHSLILGSSMGVPVIGIGITPKFDAFFRMIAQDFFLVDPSHDLEEALFEKVRYVLSHRERIVKELLLRTDHLRSQAAVSNEVVLKLLNRGMPG